MRKRCGRFVYMLRLDLFAGTFAVVFDSETKGTGYKQASAPTFWVQVLFARGSAGGMGLLVLHASSWAKQTAGQ
jgi:hypothetical protein